MLKRGNASMMVGASSWKDQLVEAFTVQSGKLDSSFCQQDQKLLILI